MIHVLVLFLSRELPCGNSGQELSLDPGPAHIVRPDGFPGRQPAAPAEGPGAAGAVYTMTNSAADNAIEAYARAGDGSLTQVTTAATAAGSGGLGAS
jgi:hypothetical protein